MEIYFSILFLGAVLQLHGDDVYFSLDEEKEDGSQFQVCSHDSLNCMLFSRKCQDYTFNHFKLKGGIIDKKRSKQENPFNYLIKRHVN